MEVAQAIRVMENAECVDKQLLATIKSWFSDYLALADDTQVQQ